MRKHILYHMLVLMLIFGPARPGFSEDVAGKSIAIVTVGAVDEALVDRLLTFSRENTALQISSARALDCSESSLEELGKCAAKHMGEQEVCVIVLAWLDEVPIGQGLHLPDEQVVVINVRSFGAEGVGEEIFLRRLERQVMQNIGLLLGLSPCPNPQCVLWPYSNLEELDAKGRNYCPPCLDRLQKEAVRRGCRLNPNSPLNIQ